MSCNFYIEEDDGPRYTPMTMRRLAPPNNRAVDSQRPYGVYMPRPRACAASSLRGLRAAPNEITNSFGDIHIGCSELDIVIDRLKLARAEYKRAALAQKGTITADLPSVAAFIAKYDTFFRFSYSSETCANVVGEGMKLLEVANNGIKFVGGTPIPMVSVSVSPTGNDDTLDKVKSIMVAAGVIIGAGAAVYLAGPLIRSVSVRLADRIRKKRK